MPAGRGGWIAGASRPVISAVAWLAFASVATAAPLFGTGYGDKDGCHYAKTGESSGSDTFFLLTDEAITTATAVCTFDGVPKKTGESIKAKVSCQAEGEEAGTPDTVDIRKSAKGYTILFKDGTKWGPLPKCR